MYFCEPKVLTLPDEAFYPVERLLLFDRHNRLTWEQTFGEQAPPWDKERRIKRWADRSVLEGVDDPENHLVAYDHFDLVTRTFKEFTLSFEEAATPNLPGAYVYPKYVVEPTPAVVVETGKLYNAQGLNPKIICLYSEAMEVAADLGGQIIEASSFLGGPFSIDWRGETRRRWLINVHGSYHNAAALVQAKNAYGVGAPGEWLDSAAGPRWASEAQDTGDQDPRPEVPIPCRGLFPEEAVWYGMAGMKTLIYRKDMESVFNPKEPPEQILGGLNPEQARTLNRIDANLTHLLSLLFQPPS